MWAYELRDGQSADSLVINHDRTTPEVSHSDVKIRVRAASINFRDLLIAKGQYGGGSFPSIIPLSDGAGEVVAVGPGVSRFKPGDRVAGCFFPEWPAGPISESAIALSLGGSRDGMLAEYVVLPEGGVVSVPDHLSFEEAATLPCAAVTAWNALVEAGSVRPGDSVLLLGTGGVSIFALQFSKLLGVRTIITSSSDEKLARAKALGADDVINYRATPDWEREVLALTADQGVDLVVEVGGGGTLERSIKAVRIGGKIVVVGVVAGQGQIDPRSIIRRAIHLQGVFVGSCAMFEAMNRAITQAKLRPIIDRTFPFINARNAYEYQGGGSHFGKVVVTVEESS